jgi:hypothetical protein
MKSLAFVFVLFVVIVTGLISCQKTEKMIEADIELISPSENSHIYLPDTLLIKLRIESASVIESVNISIVNSNYISLFGTNTIHSPVAGKEIETTMLLRTLQDYNDGPYKIKVTVKYQDIAQNTYFDIQLTNKPLVYKGFFLFSRPGIQLTKIDYYDQNLNDTAFAVSSGEYLDSDVTCFYKRLFLLTDTPAKLKTFSITDQLMEWEAEPAFPNPGFTDIQINEDRIYAGMERGQIVGYSQLNGQQKLVTEMLTDSFPENIFIMEDFIIGDYLSRMNGNRTLVTFYKETGAKKQRQPISFQVVSYAETAFPDKVLVIGNENQKGKISVYNVLNNYFENTQQIDEGEIMAVCEINEETILISIGRSVYLYNYKQSYSNWLATFDDSPVNIYFEHSSQQLMVQFEKSLSIFMFPGMEEVTRLNFEKTLKGLMLYYQFD